MTKTVKVYYAQLPNMGDLLNELLLSKLFHIPFKRNNVATCELSVIGSGMDCFLSNNPIYPRYYSMYTEMRSRLSMYPVNVWGTGFLFSERNDSHFFRTMNFHSLRGNLTKRRVEAILDKKLDIPTGDGGLLASYLFDKPFVKKHELGIIAHFKEQDEPIFHFLKEQFKNSILINLRDDPMRVIADIAECDFIISSSLHGLIVADSFGIPNQWIDVSDKLKGDGFKFHDYYSSFGIKMEPIKATDSIVISKNNIIDNYRIPKDMVESKQSEIYNAFPY